MFREQKEELGGGGSGVAFKSSTSSDDYWAGSGGGSAGTSYSGGSGGGGSYVRTSSSSRDSAGSGYGDGGAGGDANSWSGSGTASNYSAGGGAGNPGGCSYVGKNSSRGRAPTGTGGLLIIYCDTFENNRYIYSCGTSGDRLNIIDNNYGAPGGASGGGSINIFFKEITKKGTISADGGSGLQTTNSKSTGYSGSGGKGCVTLGRIVGDGYEAYTE